MSEFVFDLQRFADTKGDSGGGEINPYTELEGNGDAKKNLFCNSLPHLRIFSSIVNNPFVKSVLDNDKDAVEKFSKYVKPVLEFTGGLYGTQGLNLEHGLNIIIETSEVIESLLAIIDTVDNSDGTKTYADFGEEITLLISRIESITDSYLKLKGDETIFMELSAVALAYGANVIATFDGTTPEEQEELAKAAAKLIGTEVASIIKTVCKDASATAPFGWVDIVTSVVIGAIEIVSTYGQHIGYYLDDNLPEETAFKEAMLDAVVSGLHDGFNNYAKGLDDWVFDSSRLLMGAGVWLGESIKSWLNKTNNDYKYTDSKKNYAEWWRTAAQRLAYGTTNVSDTIEVDAANSSLYAQDGNDRIYSVYRNVTIYGGHGNDSISLYEDAKFNSVFGGTGDDYLYSASTNGTIYGGKDADFFFVSGNKNVLFGEEDNDKIVVQGNLNSISGGKGNDLIILDGAKSAVVGYTPGDGVDAIFGYDTSDIIKIKGDYSTVVSGNDIIIQVGDGGIIVKDAKDLKLNINTIELEEGETLPETQPAGITNPYGNSIMLMPNFGDGSKILRGTNLGDKIKNTLDNIMIYGFDGNDSIENTQSNVLISTGDGNDSIVDYNDSFCYGEYVTIAAGDDNDSIFNGSSNVSINAGDDNDYVCNGGWQRDYHGYLGGSNVTINAGDDNDYVHNDVGGYNVLIDGGDGSDTINNSGENVTINGGAGNDSIYNYGDSVTIDAGVGNDSIWNYSDWGDSNYIGGTNVSINAGDGNDYILNNRQEIIIGYEKWSDEAIISFYEYSTIDGGDGSDTIDNDASNVTINGGAGNDSIQNAGSNTSINADDGNDYIANEGSDVTIDGSDGNDRLDNWGNKVTIRGGEGSDFLRNNNRDDSVILDGGSDNDSIRNFGSNSTLMGGDGDDTIGNYKFAYDESTNKLKSDNGAFNVTIIGGVGKDSIYNSGFNALIETGDDDDTIDNGTLDYNSGGAYATIDAGAGNDRIHNDSNSVKINGEEGDDSITNDSGGTNALITTDEGDDSIKNYGNNVIIDAGEGYDYIYNYNGDNVSIDANTGNDFISNRGSNVSINSGFGNDSVSNIGERVTVNAGDGNDYIYNGGNSVTVNAGDGNDSIQNYGDSVTIDGGAGNDFVDLGSYYSNFNVIQYTSGDGNDTIYGFDEDDTLQIVGGTYSTQTADDDLILNVGTGKIIIVDAANKTLNIDGEKISEIYWRLDGTTATYGTANETLVTVSGVKSLDGLSVDGKVVTVSAAALNKTKISISGDGYTLALGSDVAKPSTKEAWSLSGSTATLKQTTSDKYSLASNAKSITHSAKTTTTLAIVKGVKSLDGLSVDGKVVTVSAAALNKTKISISGDGYTLALGSDVAKPSTKEAWSLSGSTATLKQTTSDKYSLASNAKSITHSAKTTTTLAIVKGVKSLDGLSVDGKVVTVSAAALNKNKVTISGDGYKLALGSNVAKPSTKEAWSLSGSTATLKQTTSDKYSLASNAKSITHSAKTTTTLAIVKGVKSLDGLSVDGKVVTVSAAALNKTKISISGDGYTLALGSDVAKPSTKEAWSLSGSTATLKQTTSDKYSLASNAKSITHSAKTTTTLAIVKGVKSLDGLSVDGKVVTVSAAALNKTKISISGDGYTLALGSDVAKPSTKEAWSLSGSTATLKQTTSDKYSLASNAKSITHSAKTTTTLAIVKGVKSLDGLSVDGKVVTVSAAALNKTKISISGDGYTLALGSDVAKPSTKEAWSLSGTTATLKQTTSDKYSLASNAKSITHSAKTTTTFATVKGVKSLDRLSAKENVVRLKANSLNKKVTVSGGGCEFDFAAGNYNGAVVNASSNNDVITSRGKNLSVSGGAGHDSINVFGTATTVTGGSGNDSLTSGLGGNVFVYASGDGKDIIANFAENDKIKVTKGTPEVTSNGSDVIVTVGKGSIKLSGATGQNISVINSKGVEKIYNPTDYWFMADTPAAAAELSSFVENYSEAYPLAEFETPNPLTQKNILLTTNPSNRRQ